MSAFQWLALIYLLVVDAFLVGWAYRLWTRQGSTGRDSAP